MESRCFFKARFENSIEFPASTIPFDQAYLHGCLGSAYDDVVCTGQNDWSVEFFGLGAGIVPGPRCAGNHAFVLENPKCLFWVFERTTEKAANPPEC